MSEKVFRKQPGICRKEKKSRACIVIPKVKYEREFCLLQSLSNDTLVSFQAPKRKSHDLHQRNEQVLAEEENEGGPHPTVINTLTESGILAKVWEIKQPFRHH